MDTWWFQGVPSLPEYTKAIFNFFDLPLDIQLCVIAFLDIYSLNTFLQASTQAKAVYIRNPNVILKGLLRQWPRQLSQLIQANLSIIQKQADPTSSLSEIYERYVDAETTARIVVDITCPLYTLQLLLRLVRETGRRSRELISRSLGLICGVEGQSFHVSMIASQLSDTECHRIYRAFLRLKLFSLLFFTMKREFPDNASYESSSVTRAFFSRLCSWEIEELNSAWSILSKITMTSNPDRRAFSSAFHNHVEALTPGKDYFQSENCPLGSSLFCNNAHCCIGNVMRPFLPHGWSHFIEWGLPMWDQATLQKCRFLPLPEDLNRSTA
ncbi:hypothetical protein V2W45_1329652 [Cenococcum geophilum]